MLAMLGCVVVLATAVALMVPAMSLTSDRAAQEPGIELNEQSSDHDGTSSGATAKADGQETSTVGSAGKDAAASEESESADGKPSASSDASASGEVPDSDAASDDKSSNASDQDEAGEGSSAQAAGAGDADDGEGPEATASAKAAKADGAPDADEGDEADDQDAKEDHPAQSLAAELLDARGKVALAINVEAPEGALPAGTTMKAKAVASSKVKGAAKQAIQDAAQSAANGTATPAQQEAAERADAKIDSIQAVDIAFYNEKGKEIEPAAPVTVTFAAPQLAANAAAGKDAPLVVHVDDQGEADVVGALSARELKKRDIAPAKDELVFDADAFSVYALVYTVDFHFEANGQTYEYSIPGGGFITLSSLVQVLGLAEEASATDADDVLDAEAVDAVKKFVADVESVEFSSPELVWIGKIDEATTVGELKEANGLECEYSADLTEEQIAEINNTGIEPEDWALINLKPFDTEECLTITMKNGDSWKVMITDGQTVTQIENNGVYMIYTYSSSAGGYVVLKGDGTTVTKSNLSDLDSLGQDYFWKFTYDSQNQVFRIQNPSSGNYITLKSATASNHTAVSTSQSSTTIWEKTDANGGFGFYGVENGNYYQLAYNTTNGLHAYESDDFSDAARIRLYSTGESERYTISLTQNNVSWGTVGYNSNGSSIRTNADNTTVTQLTKTNKQANNTITATAASGYKFTHWAVTGGSVTSWGDNEQTYTSASIKPTVTGNVTLTAVFTKDGSSSSGGSSGIVIDQDERDRLDAWLQSLKEERVPLQNVDKTAKVYGDNYENRIYEINLTAESQIRDFYKHVDLGFVLDASASMKFPSSLKEVTDSTGNDVVLDLTTSALNTQFPNGGTYYVIGDPSNTSTVYKIWRDNDNKWYFRDASKTGDKYLVDDYYKTTDTNKKKVLKPSDRSDSKYVIYYDADSPKTRLNYLNSSLTSAITLLKTIVSDTGHEGGDTSSDIRIAYNTFAYKVLSHEDFTELESDSTLSVQVETTEGGTSQDLALEDALTFSWNTSNSKYAVLITDGAAVANSSRPKNSSYTSEQIQAEVKKIAKDYAKQGITLITVGLSTDNVKGGSDLLSEIAGSINGENQFYSAESGQDLYYILLRILYTIMAQADVGGSVEDTIDAAFYPISKSTGEPLEPGTLIGLDGEIATDTSKPYGIIGYDEETGTYTVIWNDQTFGWADKNTNWSGKVYVKAKEDFLGGNTISTNCGKAKVTANSFTMTDENGQNPVVVQIGAVTTELDTPYVNVDELSLDGHDTEWTVYLGTKVTPENQLRELFNNTIVYEVVSAKDSDNRRSAGSTMKTESGFEAGQFYLKDTVGELTDEQLATLVSEGTLTIDYASYDDSRYGTDHVGTITLTLTKSGDGSAYEEHSTTSTGTPTETYTLNVKYTPSSVNSTPDYHTTSGGSAGDQAGTMEATNTHKINVYAKKLTINKVDQSNNPITTSPATFKLYRKAVATDSSGDYVPSSNLPSCLPSGDYILAETLTMSNGAATTDNLNDSYDYYLVETSAPAGYNALGDYFTVSIGTQDSYVQTLDSSTISTTAWDPWVLSGWDQKSVVIVSGTGDAASYAIYGEGSGAGYTYDTDSTAVEWMIRNDAGIRLPDAGGPGAEALYLLGIALTVLAAAILLARARQKQS